MSEYDDDTDAFDEPSHRNMDVLELDGVGRLPVTEPLPEQHSDREPDPANAEANAWLRDLYARTREDGDDDPAA